MPPQPTISFFLLVLTFFHYVYSQQPYEGQLNNDCTNNSSSLLGYFCNGKSTSCTSYLTFHPTSNNASSISSLLNVDPSLLTHSNLTSNSMLVIPVNCSCSKQYYQYNTTYSVRPSDTYSKIADNTFQALSTCQAIINQNPSPSSDLQIGQNLNIPLRCACQTTQQYNSDIRYLLTYLVNAGDTLSSIAQTFGVDVGSVAYANNLTLSETIYSFTTILVPLKTKPNYSQISEINSPPAPPSAPSPPPSPQSPPPSHSLPLTPILIGAGAFVALLVICAVAGDCYRRSKRTKQISTTTNDEASFITSSQEMVEQSLKCGTGGDCQIFPLTELKSATYNFSEENKLGQGGFGSVYKGDLPDGTIIAVKRLAGCSKQGFLEFKNEVDFLAKLKHKNLVKLVGYCLEKNEKLLCYEYLPCGSLDVILDTDKLKKNKLSWQTRYKIIKGISSGLLYLHVESGLKIIHRDLKPSNILLDEHMNPKISDFGLARLYNDDKSYMETSKFAGTYGYIAPELAMHGTYSDKYDVYSFGVMLLEIVTGRKISSFGNNQLASNLISYARQHWENGELEVLKDPTLEDSCLKQLSRCIHIGLLCVEQDPNNRPDMDAINLMLRNDSITIPALPRLMSRMEFSLSQDSMNIGS